MRALVVTALLACLVSGCASRQAWIASGVRYELRPPAELGRSIAVVQQVEVRYGDQHARFLSQIEASPEAVTIAGLTPGGQRVFLLRDDGRHLTFEPSPLLTVPVRAKYLLADLQLAFWPADAVERGLRGGLLVTAPNRREVFRQGECVIRIDRPDVDPWQGTTRYEHFQRGYALTIHSQYLQ